MVWAAPPKSWELPLIWKTWWMSLVSESLWLSFWTLPSWPPDLDNGKKGRLGYRQKWWQCCVKKLFFHSLLHCFHLGQYKRLWNRLHSCRRVFSAILLDKSSLRSGLVCHMGSGNFCYLPKVSTQKDRKGKLICWHLQVLEVNEVNKWDELDAGKRNKNPCHQGRSKFQLGFLTNAVVDVIHASTKSSTSVHWVMIRTNNGSWILTSPSKFATEMYTCSLGRWIRGISRNLRRIRWVQGKSRAKANPTTL